MLFDADNPKAFFKNVDFFDPVSASVVAAKAGGASLAAGTFSGVGAASAAASVAAPVVTTAATGGGFLSALTTGLQIVGGIAALTQPAAQFQHEAELTRETGEQLREDARIEAINKRIADKKAIKKTKALTSEIFDPDAGTPLYIEALNEETSDENIGNILRAGESGASALDAEAELIQARSTSLKTAAGIRAAGAGISLLNKLN